MSGIDLATAEARLTSYLSAEEAVLSGQSFEIDLGVSKRKVELANIESIRKGIEYWNGWCQRLGGGRSGVQAVGVKPI